MTHNARFVIINSYSYDNAGDAAIVLSTIALLRTLRPACSVRIATRYAASDASHYSRAEVVVDQPLLPFPVRGESHSVYRSVRLAAGLVRVMLLLLCVRFDRYPRAFMSSSLGKTMGEFVVICGGGYLYSSERSTNLSLLHSLVSIRLACRISKGVLMMPQSIGPITRRLDRLLVEWALQDVEPVLARETRSLASCRPPLQISPDVLPDIAFFGSGASLGAPERVPMSVRIVVMDWTWARSGAGPEGFHSYVQRIAALASTLCDTGHVVTLGGHSRIPEQGQDDLETAFAVAEIEPRVQVDPNADVYHLYDCYARSEAVVATRLHAAIMSVTVGTPACVLGYQPKARGTWDLVGLGSFHDVESFTPEAVLRSLGMLSESDKQIVRNETFRARDETRRALLDQYGVLLSRLDVG